MAAPAAADVRRKPYYSSRPIRYLEEQEWRKMHDEIRDKIGPAQETEFLLFCYEVLRQLPDEKTSHIPGNYYWVHAVRIFEHWLFISQSYMEMHEAFPTISAPTASRLVDWWMPKVCSEIFHHSLDQIGDFARKWLCCGTWEQRVELGKAHFVGPIAGEGAENDAVSATLIVRLDDLFTCSQNLVRWNTHVCRRS